MAISSSRRHFIKAGAASLAGAALARPSAFLRAAEPRFRISLAEWSFHKALKSGEMDHLDFAKRAREHGILGVEYVNQFFGVKDDRLGLQPKDQAYLAEMKKRAADLGVTNVLIMCDNVGDLGNPDDAKRTAAVEGHYAWADAAKFLDCHSIRVNARSNAKLTSEEQAKYCIDGLRRLSEHVKSLGLGVIVENHGGWSSNGAWLAGVMKGVGLDNCGTLPDFGNFYMARKGPKYEEEKASFGTDPAFGEDDKGFFYDRYKGISDLMPFAKGVSAKSHDFNEAGEEVHTDFHKAMSLVKDAGYHGWVGIEYEGSGLSEPEGVTATKVLLDKVLAELG